MHDLQSINQSINQSILVFVTGDISPRDCKGIKVQCHCQQPLGTSTFTRVFAETDFISEVQF